MITQKDISEVYTFLRTNNQTISDEVLNFVKETCEEKLIEIEKKSIENIKEHFNKGYLIEFNENWNKSYDSWIPVKDINFIDECKSSVLRINYYPTVEEDMTKVECTSCGYETELETIYINDYEFIDCPKCKSKTEFFIKEEKEEELNNTNISYNNLDIEELDYCPSCSKCGSEYHTQEDVNTLRYSRTTANGDWYFCTDCGEESINIDIEDEDTL